MAKVRHKDVRRDLEEDVLLESGRAALEYVQKHHKAMVWGLLAVVVLYAAFQIVGRYRSNMVDAANYEMLRARQLFLQSLRDRDTSEKSAADGQEILSRIVDAYSGPVQRRALFASGVDRFYELEFGKARDRFTEFANKADNDIDRARGHLAVGKCYENEAFVKDDPSLQEKALDSYQTAAGLAGDSYVKYQAMVAQAGILEKKPETRAEAVKLLEEVVRNRQRIIDEADRKTSDTKQTVERRPGVEELQPVNLVEVAKKRLEKIQAEPPRSGSGKD